MVTLVLVIDSIITLIAQQIRLVADSLGIKPRSPPKTWGQKRGIAYSKR